jgi:hypothetical protein
MSFGVAVLETQKCCNKEMILTVAPVASSEKAVQTEVILSSKGGMPFARFPKRSCIGR